jgi:tetratricopeptide (TPR) repeat protein
MQNSADTILFARHCQELLGEKKIREAIDLCERGVRNFPFYAEGHYILGRCYQALGQIDEAKNELERTLFFAPIHLKALNSLAFILYKKNLKNLADEYLLTAALNDPLNFELHDYLKQENLYSMLYPDFAAEPVEPEINAQQVEEENEDSMTTVIEQVTHSNDEDVLIMEDTDSTHDLEDTFIEPQDSADSGAALELDDSRSAFEVNSILENISDVESNKLDLSQYANIEDDFSTLLFSMEKDFQETLNDTIEEDDDESDVETESKEEEQLAEEKPIGNTAILFNEIPTSQENEFEEVETQQEEMSFDSVLENVADDSTTNMANGKNTEEIPFDSILEKEDEKKDSPEFDPIETEEELQAENEEKFKNSPDELSKIISKLENREDAPPQKVAVDNFTPPVENEPEAEEGNIQDIMNNKSLVTPTFGEILIAQKKFEEARTVFVKLLEEHPNTERYKKKLQFLDKLIALQK